MRGANPRSLGRKRAFCTGLDNNPPGPRGFVRQGKGAGVGSARLEHNGISEVCAIESSLEIASGRDIDGGTCLGGHGGVDIEPRQRGLLCCNNRGHGEPCSQQQNGGDQSEESRRLDSNNCSHHETYTSVPGLGSCRTAALVRSTTT